EAQAARIVRDDGTLEGGHIVMNQLAQTVQVVGPGAITMLAHTEEKAEDENAQPLRQPGLLNITWQQSMQFDNRGNFAHFVGDVVSNAQSGRDSSVLKAKQDLRIDMTTLVPLDDEAGQQLAAQPEAA